MIRVIAALSAAVVASSCLVIPENARPKVEISADLNSQYNFRGQVNSDSAVILGAASIELPAKRDSGVFRLEGAGAFELEDDNGTAWFPDQHAGEFSQYDLSLLYSEEVQGFFVTGGVISYAIQNPDDLPFATERGETKELFLNIARPIAWELVPHVRGHYDFDEVDDWYLNAGVSRGFELAQDWALDVETSLGYSSADQSDWTYGLKEAGLSDARVDVNASYFHNANATFTFGLHGASIIDRDLNDWFDLLGIETENFWASVGFTLSY